MPPYQGAPYPHDIEIASVGYSRPPAALMRQIGAAWYDRDSLPWFPERSRIGALSERSLPSKSETTLTVRDRSGGFGWSDVPGEPDDTITVYAYTDAVDAAAAGDGQGVDCSTENAAFLGPLLHTVTMTGGDGAFAGSFELTVGGTRYLYVVFGTKMFRSSNGTTFSAVQANGADLPATLTSPPVVFQGAQSAPQVYFAHGSGTVFSTWTGAPANGFGTGKATSVNGYANNNKVISFLLIEDHLFALGLDTTTGQEAYRVNAFYDGVADNAANRDPAWLPSIAVSDRSDAGQFLMARGETVYVGCNQTLRALDPNQENMREIVWTTQPSTTNFKYNTNWRDELWFNGGQGTYRVSSQGGTARSVADVFEQVGPEMLPNNRTPIRGTITAKAGDDYCLYCFLKTEAGVTYLLKYRYYEGGKRAAFHSILRIGTYTVSFATVSTVQGTNPILYFDIGSTTLQYFLLPRNGFFPPNDSNCEFTTKGYIFDTRMYGGLYFVTKALIAFTPRAEGTSSTETITAYYRTGAADSFTQYDTVSVVSDPGARLLLTSPVACSWWEGRVKLLRGATTTLTPKLLSSTYSYAVRPVAKGYFTMYIWIQDHIRLRNGQADPRMAYDIENALVALDSSASLSTIRNKRGLAYDVFIDEVKIIHLNDEADHSVEAVARVTASEFQSRGIGTHNALDGYTHNQLDAFTHNDLLSLL